MSRRTRLSKSAAAQVLPGQRAFFPDARLMDMPLAKGRVAKAQLVFKVDGGTELRLQNLEEVLAWSLDLARITKADPATVAATFRADGSRHVRAFKDVPAAPSVGAPATSPPQETAISGISEFGLQTDDEKEYFLSKFGDLVGVVRIKRTEKGWSAGLAKDNVPRVLSEEAVRDGLMPPSGHSALPRSLEAVVPAEYQFWKAQGEEARTIRDALVASGFFNADCIKAVDGELRKVEVKFFLYEPGADVASKRGVAKRVSLGDRIAKLIPPSATSVYTPMAEPDWLEALDKQDAEGAVAVLSPPDRGTSAREMARAASTLKGDFLLEHDDTRTNRAAFASLGSVFKVLGEPSRVFVASFPVTGVLKGDDGPVQKTVDFQGIRVDIDRPVGFVQTGKDQDGNAWTRTYSVDYGFIPRTNGGDGASLDVFLGKDSASPTAFWAIQNKADGTFDEHKLFLGFGSMQEALSAWSAHIPPRFLGDMLEVPVSAIKALLNLEPTALAKSLTSYVRKVNGVSYDQLRALLCDALVRAYPPKSEGDGSCYPGGVYVEDLYDSSVIFTKDRSCFQQPYAYANGDVQLSGQPVEVVRGWLPKAQLGQASAKAFSPASGAQLPHNFEHPLKPGVAKEVPAEVLDRVVKAINVGKDGDEHYVLGVVLEPDVVDAQNDTYTAEEVRLASERFMEQHRNMGLMHKGHVNDKVQILENYIAPADFKVGDEPVRKGTWMMAVRVKDDDLWQAIKQGGLTGFSIGGSAIRKPAEEGV